MFTAPIKHSIIARMETEKIRIMSYLFVIIILCVTKLQAKVHFPYHSAKEL